MKRIAVVAARGLGDGLLSMILSHNLTLSGYKVTTFSNSLCELTDWFPGHTISPLKSLNGFDQVIAADHTPIKEGKNVLILKEDRFDKRQTMVENIQKVCQKTLVLPYAEQTNGLIPPKGLGWRKYPKRVILHPMSTDPKKNWPQEKFLALGEALEKEGFEPYFCMSPEEREQWKHTLPETKTPLFPSLNELAAFVYESGSMIGNDSGIGHLASLFTLPTVTLFARKGYAKLWRPGWGPGVVVTPPPLLFGSRLKQKCWKKLLSVKRVRMAYKKMGAER